MKTASLILRILAILGALLALIGWVMVSQQGGTDVEQWEDQIAALTAEKQTLASAAAEAEAQLQQATQAVATAEAERDSTRATVDQLRRTLSRRDDELRAAQQIVQTRETTIESLRNDLAEARAENQAVGDQSENLARIDELQAQLQAAQSEFEAAQERLASARSDFDQTTSELEATKEQLANLEREKDRLTQANAELRIQLSQANARPTTPSSPPPATPVASQEPTSSDEPVPQAPTRPTFVDAPPAPTPPPPMVEAVDPGELQPTGEFANVLRVSRPDGFFILNRGSEDGWETNDRLAIAPGLSAPVQVVVDRVFNTISVVNVLPDQDWGGLSEGVRVEILR